MKGFRETRGQASQRRNAQAQARLGRVRAALCDRTQPVRRQLSVTCHKVRLDRHGDIRQREPSSDIERALRAQPPSSTKPTWTCCACCRRVAARSFRHGRRRPAAEGRRGDELMRRLISSGRAHLAVSGAYSGWAARSGATRLDDHASEGFLPGAAGGALRPTACCRCCRPGTSTPPRPSAARSRSRYHRAGAAPALAAAAQPGRIRAGCRTLAG